MEISKTGYEDCHYLTTTRFCGAKLTTTKLFVFVFSFDYNNNLNDPIVVSLVSNKTFDDRIVYLVVETSYNIISQ